MTELADNPTYFRWQAAPTAPAFAISAEAVAGIRAEVIRGLKSLPRRGAEVGGALLGRKDPATGEYMVEGFVPVPIEYESGPSYVLSARDTETWRAKVAELRFSSPPFIGVYRSQTRPGLTIQPEDCTTVETFLPREKGILLLVKPLSPEECVGAIYLCDGGAIVDQAINAREFPFGHTSASSSAAPAAQRTTRRKTSAWIPVSAALAGIALAVLFHYRTTAKPTESVVDPIVEAAPPPPPPTLHFRAEPAGTNARIAWDPASPLLKGASGADIDVADGNTHRTLRLTASDLRTGYVEWRTHAPEATFRMNVPRRGDSPVIESARFVNPAPAINSSSDRPYSKPAPAIVPSPSADSGPEIKVRPEEPVHRAARPRVAPYVTATQRPGRVRRIFTGITTKASHLWPFRSANPEQQTR